MSDLTVSLIATGSILGGVLAGLLLQILLPGHHLSKESQDTVKLGAGVVATMSALVLGLLVSSAKNSYDSVNMDIVQNGARLVLMDRILADYGPEAKPVREMLKNALADRIAKIWPAEKNAVAGLQALEKSNFMELFQKRLNELVPADDAQKTLLAQARQISSDIWQNRLLLIEQQQVALPPALLWSLVAWLTLLFLSFGLFSPRNITVFAVLLVSALSVSSAIFLILEMNHPLNGLIKVSNAPLVKALELIGH